MLVGIEPVLDILATYVVPSDMPQPDFAPDDEPVACKGRGDDDDVDDCCAGSPGPAKVDEVTIRSIGNGIRLDATASHPCGIRRLSAYLGTVKYTAKPDGKGRDRVVTEVANTGITRSFDCSSTATKRSLPPVLMSTAALRKLGLVGRLIAAGARAESCCFTADQGAKGRGESMSKDFIVRP